MKCIVNKSMMAIQKLSITSHTVQDDKQKEQKMYVEKLRQDKKNCVKIKKLCTDKKIA